MVFGIVSPSHPLRPTSNLPSLLQPAALILKTGVVRPRPRIDATETTKEASIYRSPNFIRLLVACFIVSYPFFIPAFVSDPNPAVPKVC